MPNVYRAYFLDSFGRIDRPPVVLQAEDDATAIDAARPLVVGQDVEVWNGRRLVKLLRKSDSETSRRK